MKDEIKEILDRLERIDHKEYIAFEFADSATFDETARCFEERKKMADYITNLQEENKKLKYQNDVWSEINEENRKRREEYRDRIDKATKFVESMEYCGQEDYFYDEQSNDPCGNDNIFDESKVKLLHILQGSDE